MLLLSPTEHDLSAHLRSTNTPYKNSSLCERNGADIIGNTPVGLIGFQRKRIDDLYASLLDGRLYKEIAQLSTSPILSASYLIVEYGPGDLTIDGDFLTCKLERYQYLSILTKIQSFGMGWLHTYSVADTALTLVRVLTYISKQRSQVLSRSKSEAKNSWGGHSNKSWALFFLQGFEGIGPKQAEAIYDHFQSLPLTWTATYSDLIAIPGIGKKTALKLLDALPQPE